MQLEENIKRIESGDEYENPSTAVLGKMFSDLDVRMEGKLTKEVVYPVAEKRLGRPLHSYEKKWVNKTLKKNAGDDDKINRKEFNEFHK